MSANIRLPDSHLGAIWKKGSRIVSVGLIIMLPSVIWWQGLASSWSAVLLLAIGVTQMLGAQTGFQRLQAILATGLALLVAAGSPQLTLYYPALVNATLLIVWAYSWCRPPTIIERLVPARHAAVPHRRRYMRRLTLAWCGIFAVNLLLALATARFADMNLWAAWNGLGAYLLVALFAGGEYLYRRCRFERVEKETLA